MNITKYTAKDSNETSGKRYDLTDLTALNYATVKEALEKLAKETTPAGSRAGVLLRVFQSFDKD